MHPGIWFDAESVTFVSVVVALIHFLGVLHALHAILHVRTAQGSIAWAISLVEFPYLALPAYWLLGRRRFEGYILARRMGDQRIAHVAASAARRVLEYRTPVTHESVERFRSLERLTRMPFTEGNDVRLLIDGEQTFEALFAAIERAERYVLVQFFIMHDDELGRRLEALLIRKAAQGVQVYLLLDAIGSHQLSARVDRRLSQAGVQVARFGSYRRRSNRFQINFRNHRKITVADGRVGFVGGLNVGMEYMGKSKRFGPWRDTHAVIEGPSVTCIQLSFLEDWHWATGEVPDLEWTPSPAQGTSRSMLVVPTGPADDLESCGLFFVHTINTAQKRVWITSPYFVPDSSVVNALQLAALRGVDVRIMLPQRPDHLLVYLSSFSYLDEMTRAGVQIYRYLPGFMHQKVLLVDDDIAAVGTANLDNRSFRLNFELTLLVADQVFGADVETMLVNDFKQCRRIAADEYHGRSLAFRLAVRTARLLAPVQ